MMHRLFVNREACFATILSMSEMRDMANDPKHRRNFEKLLYLAAKFGNADQVVERLSWAIDPNCTFKRGRTPLIANCIGFCPNAATVQALLKAGADPSHIDEAGLNALDYARRKLAKLQAHPPKPQPKSPSLDENNQLQLNPEEQAEFDEMRSKVGTDDQGRRFLNIWWQERLRVARRVFNDVGEVEKIVGMLEEC